MSHKNHRGHSKHDFSNTPTAIPVAVVILMGMCKMIRVVICLMLIPIGCGAMTLVEKQAYIQQLQNKIHELDLQIAECSKNKTAWTATTVFGALGTVGTGVGVAVQSAQIHKLQKSEISPDENQGDKK